MATVRTDAVYKVRCPCGAIAAIEVHSFGRSIRCKKCSGSYKVVWGLDPKTKRKIPVTVDPQGSTKTVFKLPPGAQELVCPCGQHLVAHPHQVGKKVQCPVCGSWLRLERYKDPQSLETRIRTIESKTKKVAAVRARDTTLRKVNPSAGIQDILCICGESLRVHPEHVGKQAQCHACGTVMRLEEIRDPQTSLTRILPRVVGKPAPSKRGLDEELSLDDFT
jgi:hypothetical protein